MALRRAIVSGLHQFMAAEELASRNPAEDLAQAKRRKGLPYTPSIDAVERLLDTAHRMAQDQSVGVYRQAGYARRAALLELLYATGMRINDAVTLPTKAIKPDTSQIIVRGKGSKERLIPLN